MVAELPRLAGEFLERWGLRVDGPPAYGMASLVLPVRRSDGTPAVLKLQQPREETAGSTAGLRAWNGDGTVRLLDHDDHTATQLLERLDATRPLSAIPDDTEAIHILADLLARLTAVPAPAGLRRLSDIAGAMLDQVPRAVPALRIPPNSGWCAPARPPSPSSWVNRATACCTGICTTTTFSPEHANPGWRSIPNRWPATRGSTCCPRWTAGGTR
ncbi:hypothetical protein FHX46_001334 [Amycolatopsis viridis]|uniref:Streptomycin 6-kinase n=1 Tax=Amycolatopsis viridis TaxID=185678 RepID=A0ABX0SQL1_9PSEU|nr:hypothetical protein [Amycolatopsis viridis]